MGYVTNYNFINHIKDYKQELDSYTSNTYNYYDTKCDSIISNYDINGANNATTCRRVMGYLSLIAQNGSSKDSANKCKYLYYWLHDDLLKNKTERDQTLRLYNDFLKLYENGRNGRHLCNNYMEEINKIVVLNAQNLIKLFTTFTDEQGKFNKCYCICAKKCYNLHKEYVEECNKHKDEDFCSELENFKYLYDRNMLYVNFCKDAPKTLVSFTPIASGLKRRKLRKKINSENENIEQHEHSHIPSKSKMEPTKPYYLLSYSYKRDT
ncbi:hypothetical protein PVNG_05524 [Plasmodium vivax North Korean]|uniref:VIR protein n=1 Tax=Plasmodium vivax North Korean TaxID=1035514 RepID=A0A0J9U1U0_PLAVI|nr:hypothetical protein PVNG_05524 [Plasmodium vivax North Korean]